MQPQIETPVCAADGAPTALVVTAAMSRELTAMEQQVPRLGRQATIKACGSVLTAATYAAQMLHTAYGSRPNVAQFIIQAARAVAERTGESYGTVYLAPSAALEKLVRREDVLYTAVLSPNAILEQISESTRHDLTMAGVSSAASMGAADPAALFRMPLAQDRLGLMVVRGGADDEQKGEINAHITAQGATAHSLVTAAQSALPAEIEAALAHEPELVREAAELFPTLPVKQQHALQELAHAVSETAVHVVRTPLSQVDPAPIPTPALPAHALNNLPDTLRNKISRTVDTLQAQVREVTHIAAKAQALAAAIAEPDRAPHVIAPTLKDLRVLKDVQTQIKADPSLKSLPLVAVAHILSKAPSAALQPLVERIETAAQMKLLPKQSTVPPTKSDAPPATPIALNFNAKTPAPTKPVIAMQANTPAAKALEPQSEQKILAAAKPVMHTAAAPRTTAPQPPMPAAAPKANPVTATPAAKQNANTETTVKPPVPQTPWAAAPTAPADVPRPTQQPTQPVAPKAEPIFVAPEVRPESPHPTPVVQPTAPRAAAPTPTAPADVPRPAPQPTHPITPKAEPVSVAPASPAPTKTPVAPEVYPESPRPTPVVQPTTPRAAAPIPTAPADIPRPAPQPTHPITPKAEPVSVAPASPAPTKTPVATEVHPESPRPTPVVQPTAPRAAAPTPTAPADVPRPAPQPAHPITPKAEPIFVAPEVRPESPRPTPVVQPATPRAAAPTPTAPADIPRPTQQPTQPAAYFGSVFKSEPVSTPSPSKGFSWDTVRATAANLVKNFKSACEGCNGSKGCCTVNQDALAKAAKTSKMSAMPK